MLKEAAQNPSASSHTLLASVKCLLSVIWYLSASAGQLLRMPKYSRVDVRPSVRQPKFGPIWVMQHDNDPKSTTECLNKESQGIVVVQVKSRSQPDGNVVMGP